MKQNSFAFLLIIINDKDFENILQLREILSHKRSVETFKTISWLIILIWSTIIKKLWDSGT